MSGEVHVAYQVAGDADIDLVVAPGTVSHLDRRVLDRALRVLFGSGIRLFEGVDAGRVALGATARSTTQRVTHLTYAVRER